MKTIVFSPSAAKQLDALPVRDQNRVHDALSSYAISGIGDVIRLTGRSEYRLKIGSYRVIFNEDRTTIVAIYVGTRTTVTYKRK